MLYFILVYDFVDRCKFNEWEFKLSNSRPARWVMPIRISFHPLKLVHFRRHRRRLRRSLRPSRSLRPGDGSASPFPSPSSRLICRRRVSSSIVAVTIASLPSYARKWTLSTPSPTSRKTDGISGEYSATTASSKALFSRPTSRISGLGRASSSRPSTKVGVEEKSAEADVASIRVVYLEV